MPIKLLNYFSRISNKLSIHMQFQVKAKFFLIFSIHFYIAFEVICLSVCCSVFMEHDYHAALWQVSPPSLLLAVQMNATFSFNQSISQNQEVEMSTS